MKFLDLFSGIGGFRLGLEAHGHECVGFCEIDKYARESYKAIHKTEGELELHDITTVTDAQWRELRGSVDILAGGFPCQAFSIAGKRQGFEDETRGTLFFEIMRAAKQIQPPLLFLENVKGLLNHDKGRTFRIILQAMDELGYDAEWQVLNSKDFGVPQNRERVFIIGHLRGSSGREVFPIGSADGATGVPVKLIAHRENYHRNTQVFEPSGITETLDTCQGGGRGHYTVVNQGVEVVVTWGAFGQSQVLDENGLATTCLARDYKDPKRVLVREATKQGYAVAEEGDSINFEQPNSKTRRGRVEKGIANTLTTGCNQGVLEPKIIDDQGRLKDSYKQHDVVPTLRAQTHSNPPKMYDGYRIRKLTQKECWRLQGYPDWAFEKAEKVNSNSQLYKQAGNSVTVNVIEAIAKEF